MSTADLIDRLEQIIAIVGEREIDHGRGGLSESNRATVERLLTLLRNEVSRSDD